MDLHGVVMVTIAGTVRTERAAGLADTGNGPGAGLPCTLQTRFQLCSVSKQFAAAAALLLAETGQLALDDPVDRWLPGGGSPQWSRVTLHHLLSHTAGLPHWHQAPGLDPAEPMSIGERLGHRSCSHLPWSASRFAPLCRAGLVSGGLSRLGPPLTRSSRGL